jgi:hypothetical protein
MANRDYQHLRGQASIIVVTSLSKEKLKEVTSAYLRVAQEAVEHNNEFFSVESVVYLWRDDDDTGTELKGEL